MWNEQTAVARKKRWLSLLACVTGALCGHVMAQPAEEQVRLHLEQVDELEVSAAAQRVAIAEHSGRVTVWNRDSGTVEHVIQPEGISSSAPVCMRFVDGGNTLLITSNSGAVRLLHLGSGRLVGRYHLWDEAYIHGCGATYGDNRLTLLVSSSDGHRIYHLQNPIERIAELASDGYGQDEALLSPDGSQLLIVSDDERTGLYNVANGVRIRTFNFPFQVQAAAFSGDARLIATGTYSGLVDVWDTDTGKRIKALARSETRVRTPADPANRVWDLAFSEGGERLVASHGRQISIWEISSGRKLNRWRTDPDTQVAFLDDEYRVIAGTRDSPTLLNSGNGPKKISLFHSGESASIPTSSTPLNDALFAAIKSDDPDQVLALLNAGADPNLVDAIGATPLWSAAGQGNVQVVGHLLEAGASVDGRSIKNATALWMAAQKGHRDIAEKLIDAGADIDAQDSFGGTALQWAAHFGHADMVALLLANDADPNLRREGGDTALSMARSRNQLEIVAALEAAGAVE